MVDKVDHIIFIGAMVFLGAVMCRAYVRKLRELTVLSGNEVTILNGNEAILNSQDKQLVKQLLSLDQAHIFQSWPPPGNKDGEKARLLKQLHHIDQHYSGGLASYIKNAQELLEDSKLGKNAFEGYTPEVPRGAKLDYGSQQFREFERLGTEAAGKAAFVLVAGGLGERLGYSGIKVALPADSARGACFLQVYIESILALQRKAQTGSWGKRLPLAIMTSDDTHERTKKLLEDNAYFGMHPTQVTLMMQEKVPCLVDNQAHLALEEDGFTLQTKPHGHGDVHSLLHSTGLAREWLSKGFEWVCFFQDTNGLVFRGLIPALGVSVKNNYEVNSLAVPRKAKEAIGGIALLRDRGGSSMTINVEYNQLDPLLRATTMPDGDVNDETGFSPFPGNINQLILRLDPYNTQLNRTGGIIAEFVNPKYKDASKEAFKSSTRLECMMQDYPKVLPATAKVGFTVVNQVWAAYSPVKNAPADAAAKAAAGNPSHSATTGELDIYRANCRALELLGARIGPPRPVRFNGLDVQLWPRVAWSPSFALTFDDLAAKVEGRHVTLDTESALVIDGEDIQIGELQLRGALVLEAAEGARLKVDRLAVENAGWEWRALEGGTAGAAPEEQRVRGFAVVRKETRTVVASDGEVIMDEGVPAAKLAAAMA